MGRLLNDVVVEELAVQIAARRGQPAHGHDFGPAVRALPRWVGGLVSVDGAACVAPTADEASVALVTNRAAAREALRSIPHTAADERALASALGAVSVAGSRRGTAG